MKKARSIPTNEKKNIGTVFQDIKGCILIDFLLRKEAANTVYVQVLQKLRMPNEKMYCSST
jgi:hypothetical protein